MASRDYLKQLIKDYAIQHNSASHWPGAGWIMLFAFDKDSKSGDYRARENREKYGRYLVELIGQKDGKPYNLNQLLVDAGKAVVYLP